MLSNVSQGNSPAVTSLVVGDDHKVFLDALAVVLAQHGYTVTVTHTVPGTISAMSEQQPDLCLIDRHFGVQPPHVERALEREDDAIARVQAVMAELKAVLDECLPQANKLRDAYRVACNKLARIGDEDTRVAPHAASMAFAIDERALRQEDPNAGYICALDEMPREDFIHDEAIERAEEDRIGAMEAAAEARRDV